MASFKTMITSSRTSARRQELIAIEAADWVARGRLSSSSDREEFSRWLMESPAHIKEFLAALTWAHTLRSDLAAWRTDVDELLAGANIVDLPVDAAPEPEHRPRRGRFSTRNLVAVSAVAAAITVAAVLLVRQVLLGPVYTTDIGEQRTVSLPDGSLVSLNTQSAVRVSYSDDVRNIYLQSGQATFSVMHDVNRPFRVHVDGNVVQALGTKFDVRRQRSEMNVAVIEGRVSVSPKPKPERSAGNSRITQGIKLSAGEGVSILPTGELTPPTPIDIRRSLAWQERRLIFSGETLSNIVAEFERYNRIRIRIRDAEVGQLKFSGVWDADRPDVLLAYLRTRADVRVQRAGDEFVLHFASAARQISDGRAAPAHLSPH